MANGEFSFEEATQPAEFSWDDVAPQPAQPAAIPPRDVSAQPLSPEEERNVQQDVNIAIQRVDPRWNVRPPEPTIGGLIGHGMEWINRTFKAPEEPMPAPLTPIVAPPTVEETPEVINRRALAQRIYEAEHPVKAGVGKSAEKLLMTMAEPAGPLALAATPLAPQVMLPMWGAMGTEGSLDAIQRIQKARETGNRAAYYEAASDLLVNAPMAASPLHLRGRAAVTAPIKFERSLDALRREPIVSPETVTEGVPQPTVEIRTPENLPVVPEQPLLNAPESQLGGAQSDVGPTAAHAEFSEPLVNRPPATTQIPPNLVDALSRANTFEDINRVGKNPAMMARVLSDISDSQVLDSIIKSVPVDVMNELVGPEFSSKPLLQQVSMLSELLSSKVDRPVSPAIVRIIDSIYPALQGRIMSVFAELGTVLPSVRRIILERAPTTPTREGYHPESVATLPPEASSKGVPLTDLAGNPAEFYSLPRLRAANARNDPQVAAAKKYYGAKTIPDLARLAKSRFEEMAKPKPATSESVALDVNNSDSINAWWKDVSEAISKDDEATAKALVAKLPPVDPASAPGYQGTLFALTSPSRIGTTFIDKMATADGTPLWKWRTQLQDAKKPARGLRTREDIEMDRVRELPEGPEGEAQLVAGDIAKAVDTVNVDDVAGYSPVPALVRIIRRAPRDPAMKTAAEQAMQKIGAAAKEQGVPLDNIKTQIADELKAVYGADAAEMAKYYFGESAAPAAQLEVAAPFGRVSVNREPSGVVRVDYFDTEGNKVGYGQLDGRVINMVSVPESYQRKGFGAAIVQDLRSRGGEIGVAGTPEGLALMRSKGVGAREYEPGKFDFSAPASAGTSSAPPRLPGRPVPEVTKPATQAVELAEPIKADVAADPRLVEPGVTSRAKPNSIVVQLRDLESRPVREVVLESTGDPLADSKLIAKVLSREGGRGGISLRESSAVSTGPNGLAIYHFGNSPRGVAWTRIQDLIEARKPTAQPTAVPATKMFVRSGNQLREVTPDQASLAMQRIREESGRGASTLGPMDLYDANGNKIGQVSYNGRVWIGDKVIAEAAEAEKAVPATKPAPEPPATAQKTVPEAKPTESGAVAGLKPTPGETGVIDAPPKPQSREYVSEVRPSAVPTEGARSAPPEPSSRVSDIKPGDTIQWEPHDAERRYQGPVDGIVVDVIQNYSGDRGYHILSPTEGDPHRVVRVWEERGKTVLVRRAEVGGEKSVQSEHTGKSGGYSNKTHTKSITEIADAIAARGVDPQSSYGEFVKARNLKPEIDAREWLTVYRQSLQLAKLKHEAEVTRKTKPAPEPPATAPPEPPTLPGPGAASPSEFSERTAKGAGSQPPEPPLAVDASTKPSPETVRQARDYQLINEANSGQWSFYFGKLGATAKAAWDRMALTAFRIRENTKRDTQRYVKDLLSSLPRDVRKNGGKAFFDVLDGKTMEQIQSEWTGKPNGKSVIDAAQQLKSRLEDIRVTIRDTKRDAYHGFLMGVDRPTLSELFDNNISRGIDSSKYSKEQFADALTRNELPDDWGIADGSYLPHIFFGNWKVTAQRGATPEFITRARTPAEAKTKIFEYTKANPDFAKASWKIEPDTVVPADILRLADNRFWHLLNQMKDTLNVSASDIKLAQQGVIGKKSSKQKWFGNLKQREGFKGYEKDYSKVMGAYLSGFHRWLELSKLQREVQPMIDQVRVGRMDEMGNRVEGSRPHAAQALENIMDYMWGKPARSTLLFDSTIQRIPWLRDRVKPLALDRYSQFIRSVVPYLTLSTARFAVVNRLQPLQGLYPLVGERILAQAKRFQHTPEGRNLLDDAGVFFDPGQYGVERGFTGKLSELRERFTGERSNQELAFLSMFQHGTESGLSRGEAINYAKLRGQLLTQFTPNTADIPPIMRGPITGLAFQFKRFPIKQGELLVKMAAQGRISGLARWFGVMVATGGLSYFLKQLWAPSDKREKLRRSITSEYGQTVADAAMYGLPGLVNADLSGSLVVGDEPFGSNIYEKVGRTAAGPAVGLAYDTGTSLLTAAREPTTVTQDIQTLLRKYPSTKPIAELISLANSDLDVRTPDGEVKYRKALKDAIVGLGAFKTANEANLQSAVNGWIAIEKEATSLKNAAFVEMMKEGGKADAALDAIQKFNERWPERAISGKELNQYIHTRAKGMDKTDYERAMGKRGAAFLPAQP